MSKRWLFLSWLGLVTLLTSACNPRPSNNDRSSMLTCHRQQEMVDAGYSIVQDYDGRWIAYSRNGDAYALNQEEIVFGDMFDRCLFEADRGTPAYDFWREHHYLQRSPQNRSWALPDNKTERQELREELTSP